MKRTSIKFLGYLALATVVASCSSLDKMRTNATDINYTVTPEVLEAHGGKVEANIRVQIPGGYFDPKATMEATPVLVYEGGETAYPSFTVQGEKASGNAQVISKLNGGQVNYTNSVDYNENMLKDSSTAKKTRTRRSRRRSTTDTVDTVANSTETVKTSKENVETPKVEETKAIKEQGSKDEPKNDKE